jgi:two-component system response regulator PilR (NtrC family)
MPPAAAATSPALAPLPPQEVPEAAANIASHNASGAVMPEGDLPHSLPDHLDDIEREIIRRALERTRYNRTQAAELLGISFRQLRYRMQRLDIQEPD